MRALYHFRTRGTGAEGVHIAGIAGALSRMGYQIDFFSPSGIQPGITKGQSPFSSKSAKGLLGKIADHAPGFIFELLELAYNIPAAVGLTKRVLTGRPTLIYQRHAFFLFTTAVLARVFKIPHVIEVNELAGDDRIRAQPVFASLAKPIDRWVLNCADLVCVVSPHLARRVATLGVPDHRIITLPNAVGPEMLNPPDPDLSPQKTPLGTRDGALVIGFVGWFVEWHRLDHLIHSFFQACEASPLKLDLVLVGEGPLEDSLRDQIADSTAGRVIFAGAIEHTAMASMIDQFDISVVPACNEFRSPIKLLEYMSRSTAVVAPDVEPIREVTQHLQNAYLFEPENPGSLAQAFVELAASKDLRQRLGNNASHLVRKQHTWDVNAQNFLARLSSLPS